MIAKKTREIAKKHGLELYEKKEDDFDKKWNALVDELKNNLECETDFRRLQNLELGVYDNSNRIEDAKKIAKKHGFELRETSTESLGRRLNEAEMELDIDIKKDMWSGKLELVDIGSDKE